MWPGGVPVGTPITVQAVVPDSGAVNNWALSNAVRGVIESAP